MDITTATLLILAGFILGMIAMRKIDRYIVTLNNMSMMNAGKMFIEDENGNWFPKDPRK